MVNSVATILKPFTIATYIGSSPLVLDSVLEGLQQPTELGKAGNTRQLNPLLTGPVQFRTQKN